MKSIIIIGAGIAGLSAGVYAQKNGYEATIYESHFLPGGMCTAWKRKNYLFEGCLCFIGLVGSSNKHAFYDLWHELGVLPGLQIINHEIFHTFRDQTGRTLNIYANIDRFQKELLTLSPQDEREIRFLCRSIKRYIPFIRSARKNPLRYLANLAGILTAIPLLQKFGSLSIAEYAQRFKDPLIRYMLTNLFVYPDFSCVAIFFFLAGMHLNAAGYPQGSSLNFMRTIEQRFLELGGKINYRKKVKRIIIENDHATGIALEDGTIVSADIVISAADGHATLFDLLDDQYTPPAVQQRYETLPVFPPFVQVSLGINRDLSSEPHAMRLETAPFFIGDQSQNSLWYHHYAFDPTLSPAGKTVLTVLFPSNLAWWQSLGYPGDAYEAEKEKVLQLTLGLLENIFPGISNQVEVSDVATPITTWRYTHNWQGSLGFMMTAAMTSEMTRKTQYTLPALQNFYMGGQWVKGFGIPTAALSGKEIIQAICEADGKKFHP